MSLHMLTVLTLVHVGMKGMRVHRLHWVIVVTQSLAASLLWWEGERTQLERHCAAADAKQLLSQEVKAFDTALKMEVVA